jgi:hypothetical protein
MEWNFRGTCRIGFIDTHRKDIKYENYKGHILDRETLELFFEYQ